MAVEIMIEEGALGQDLGLYSELAELPAHRCLEIGVGTDAVGATGDHRLRNPRRHDPINDLLSDLVDIHRDAGTDDGEHWRLHLGQGRGNHAGRDTTPARVDGRQLAVLSEHQDRNTVSGADGKQQTSLAGDQGVAFTKQPCALCPHHAASVNLREHRYPGSGHPQPTTHLTPASRRGASAQIQLLTGGKRTTGEAVAKTINSGEGDRSEKGITHRHDPAPSARRPQDSLGRGGVRSSV